MRTARLASLIALAALPACDRARDALPWSEAEDPAPTVFRAERRTLLFLADSAAEPVAAALRFGVEPVGERVGRSAGLWLGGPGGWERLMRERWREPAVREPTRILPREDLRLVLDETGELVAVTFRGTQPGLRLALGDVLAEGGADSASVRIRSATLTFGEQAHAGFLIDATSRGPGAPPARALLVGADGLAVALVADTAGTLRAEAVVAAPGAIRLRPSPDGDGAADAWQAVDGGGEPLGTLAPVYPGWAPEEAPAPQLIALTGSLALPDGDRRVAVVLDRIVD